MANYLITGVSSGIGRELTKWLIKEKHKVIGIARRKDLLVSLKNELHQSKNFDFICTDVSNEVAWKKIVRHMSSQRFLPDVIIFNAAIFEKDYQGKNLDFSMTRKMLEVNFFSIIKGFEEISMISKPNTQFIFISSSSALKGSGAEGIGYPASKAALSAAFESLYLKYRGIFRLKIIYFGPINTEMLPFTSRFTPTLSKTQAIKKIITTIKNNSSVNYSPWHLFLFLRTIKILPGHIYLTILNLIDILHLKSSQK